jgi:hypothetical protein
MAYYSNYRITLRPTSFGLMLMHKPAYEFRWGEIVVGRSF